MTDLLPRDAPIFRGIVCTLCGAQFDAARLRVVEDPENHDVYYTCPNCGSDEIDWALWKPKT